MNSTGDSAGFGAPQTFNNPLPTPPLPAQPPPGAPDNYAALFSLLQAGTITRAQFDTLTGGAATTPSTNNQSPNSQSSAQSPPNQAQSTDANMKTPAVSPTQIPPHLALPVPPGLSHPSPFTGTNPPFYAFNPSLHQSFPYPSPHPSLHGVPPPRTGSGAIPANALQAHLTGMESVRKLQQQIAMAQASLNAGVSVSDGKTLNLEQKEQLEQERRELTKQQTVLVGKHHSFIQANGGSERVASEIRAFRSAQNTGSNVPPPPSCPNQGPYPPTGPFQPPWFPVAAGGDTPTNQPTNHPPFTSSPNPLQQLPLAPGPYATPTPYYHSPPSQPPSSFTSSPNLTTALPNQSLPSQMSSLPPGLQASLAARAQAANRAATSPPLAGYSKPIITPTFRSDNRRGSSHDSPPGSQIGLGLSSGPTRAKHATQILAEGAPNMPSLTQLQNQLKPEAFASSLRTVMGKRGIEIREPYFVENVKIPLYDLFQAVMVKGGGGEKVAADHHWPSIAREINLPDSIPFSDTLARLYSQLLAPYEDVWSTALLKQREKMAAAHRFRGSGSSEGSASGETSTPRPLASLPSTGLKFSEPVHRPSMSSNLTNDGPPPQPSAPPAASSHYAEPKQQTAEDYFRGQNLSSWPNFPKSSEGLMGEGETAIRRPSQQQGVSGPFSLRPPPIDSIETHQRIFGYQLAGQASRPESGRFEELSTTSEPTAKKGRRSSKAGSSLGTSPADSTHSPNSNGSPTPGAPIFKKSSGSGSAKSGQGKGKKRERVDQGGDTNLDQDRASSQNGGDQSTSPSGGFMFLPPPSSSFDVNTGWNGDIATWPPTAGPSSIDYGLASLGDFARTGSSDFDMSQFLSSAVSPTVMSNTPEPSTSNGIQHGVSPPQNNSRSQQKPTNEASTSSESHLPVDTSTADWPPTPAMVEASTSFAGFGQLSGLSEGWDSNDPEKWKLPQSFEFDSEFASWGST
ncbi:hypothetical protein P7C70_g6171, partial [Phenoliferia sp. Uapishka_3]